MAMNAKCPRCGSKYDIEQDEIGHVARCEVCGNRFVIDASRFRRFIVSLFSFSGRIWRREYLKVLAIVAVPVAVMVVVGMFVDPAEGLNRAEMLRFWLPYVTFRILAAPASIRRLHDFNLSGIWYSIIVGIALIPVFGLVGYLILSCIPGTRGSNKYDGIQELSQSYMSPCRAAKETSQTDVGNPQMTPRRGDRKPLFSLVGRWFSYKGRACRKEFWFIQGICLVSWLLIDCSASSKPVTIISYIILGWATLCAWIRRAHDLNQSGFPVLWFNAMAVLAGTGISTYKGLLGDIMSVLLGLTGLMWLIALGTLDGTPGANDYGNDPQGRVGTGERKGTFESCLGGIVGVLTLISIIVLITARVVRGLSTDEHIESTPVFSEVRDLEAVVTRQYDRISNDCLYRYPYHLYKIHNKDGLEVSVYNHDLEIEQVFEGEGVLIKHKDWSEHGQDIFIAMNTDDLVDEDPLPPVMVQYAGIFRYKTVLGAERSVRAFKVVKKYKIISE